MAVKIYKFNKTPETISVGKNMQRVKILNTQIADISMNEALERAEELIISGKGGKIFTPNATMIERAKKDAEFSKILNSSSFSVCDGIGASVASFVLGKGLLRRVCGVELGERLAELCAKKGYSLYLLGGETGIAERAAENLIKKYPDLRIAGTHSGFFTEEWRVLSEISLSGAQVLYVCLGSPKQEKFIYYNQKYLSDVLMLGLGGSLDVYAEKKKRAPAFLRKVGLEWAYRIAKEPHRMKKTRLLPFVFSVISERISVKNIQNKQENFAKKQ